MAVAVAAAATLAVRIILLRSNAPQTPPAETAAPTRNGAASVVTAAPLRDGAASTPPANAAAAAPSANEVATSLSGDSTLAQWRKASAADRSQVAVALARNRLAPDATKLDIAKTAMEITGCVSATARDERFAAWKVSPTAATCLTAPEREPK